MGREARVTDAGDYRFLRVRSDPFFFDTRGSENLQFTGAFLADKDVSASRSITQLRTGPPDLASGARTLHDVAGNGFRRTAARGAALLLTARRTLTNLAGEPADDARFVAVFAHRYNTRALYAAGCESGHGDAAGHSPYDPKRRRAS